MSNTERNISPANAALVLKALLLGHEIETENGSFRYFRKGDWIPISEAEEGQIAEEGIFRSCEVIHHQPGENLETVSHRWLLWLTSITDFIRWVESLSPIEVAVIAANLTLTTSLKNNRT